MLKVGESLIFLFRKIRYFFACRMLKSSFVFLFSFNFIYAANLSYEVDSVTGISSSLDCFEDNIILWIVASNIDGNNDSDDDGTNDASVSTPYEDGFPISNDFSDTVDTQIAFCGVLGIRYE